MPTRKRRQDREAKLEAQISSVVTTLTASLKVMRRGTNLLNEKTRINLAIAEERIKQLREVHRRTLTGLRERLR